MYVQPGQTWPYETFIQIPTNRDLLEQNVDTPATLQRVDIQTPYYKTVLYDKLKYCFEL